MTFRIPRAVSRVLLLVLLATVSVTPLAAIFAGRTYHHTSRLFRQFPLPSQFLQTDSDATSEQFVAFEKMSAGWDEANHACALVGRRLCWLREYCPNGRGQPPVGGAQNGDAWAAIGDNRGEFASVGDAFRDRLCGTHTNCCGTTPAWGNLGYSSGMNLLSRCCGAVDPSVKARAHEFKVKRYGSFIEDSSPYTVAPLPGYDRVLEHMQYYKRRQLGQHDLARLTTAFPIEKGHYFAQELDPGGFNNIRQGFEHAVFYALISGRTLLTMPATPWYLLDFGPKARQDQSKNGKTKLEDIYDIDDLCTSPDDSSSNDPSPLRCLTPTEFLKTDAGRELAARANMRSMDDPSNQDWLKLLLQGSDAQWAVRNANAELLAWPSKAALLGAGRWPDRNVRGGRTLVELSQAQRDATVVHAHITQHHRHLGQIAAAGAFTSDDHYRLVHRFFHDRVHFKPEIFEVAARVVSFLGLFNYTAMHIRRGDLQYAEVKLEPRRIRYNIGALLHKHDLLYIATDEMQADFLDPFKADEHVVYRWDDFFTDRGGNVLRGIKINHKHVGMIEQIILACGRRFIGTPQSTFSALVPRLAGYIGAPDTHVYQITQKYRRPLSRRPKVDGADIYTEFHEFYGDI